MTRIKIEISDTVSEQQRNDPRFQELLEAAESFFNSPYFSERYRSLLSLHESAHGYYARKTGSPKIKYYGPTMLWDSKYDCPAISKSRTYWEVPVDGRAVDIVKPFLAGFICRREMSNSPNNEVAIESDMDGCRVWFDRRVGTGDAGFAVALEEAEREILIDIQNPLVQQEIFEEARQFAHEIFPAPKLTSSVLRARRLGWAK